MTAEDVAPSAAVAEAVEGIVARIVDRFRPLQVILFGSRARGDARPWSDVDLLVVLPDGCDRHRAWREIGAALRDVRVPHDVIVTTPEEIERRGNLVGPALRPALRDGVLLYDVNRGMIDRGSGTGGQDSGMPRGGPVSDDERLAETRRWLRQAREDLRMAELVDDGEDAAPGIACYHAQQAAEKALKAVLVYLQIPFPRTHKLDELRDLIPTDWAIRTEYPELRALSEWAYKGRYPGDWPDATVGDAQSATRQARAIWEGVLDDLERRGFRPEEE